MTRKLWIAVGKNRQSSFIEHHEASWDQLSKRLTTFKRTPETYAEYMAASKDFQLATKDVGSFVGGKFSGDTRRKDELELRSVLCLDMDHVPVAAVGAIGITYSDVAHVCHSTHKHSPEHPRLRLVFPLSRDVTIHEYEPLAREVASWFGMDAFDSTGFQPARVMFWPSASSDATIVSINNDGTWLDPDALLNAMGDWADPFTWPLCPNEKAAPRGADARVEYAPGKRGVIGAFCRVYDIHRAIAEFELPYEETAAENRYTYTAGSSAQGAVVYDFDTQLFSHHETDPASGLHNAWDLVRLHKFGDTEESNSDMKALAMSIDEVTSELGDTAAGIVFEDLSVTDKLPNSPISDTHVEANVDTPADVPTVTPMEQYRERIEACQTDQAFDQVVTHIAANYDKLSGNQLSQLANWLQNCYNTVFGKSNWNKKSVLDTFRDKRDAMAGATTTQQVDKMEELAQYVYDEAFGAGAKVRRVARRFWKYDAGLWYPVEDETIQGIIQDVVVKLRKADIGTQPLLQAAIGDKESHVAAKAILEFLRAAKAYETDAVGGRDPMGMMRSYPLPVVNCKNCTLRFDANGKMTVHAHDPDDFFTSQLDVDYDPSARCPEWDEFVGHVFSNEPLHADEMMRHLEEFGGYVIQYSRWLKIWSLFYGNTNTGKSTFQELLTDMLGTTSVLARAVDSDSWTGFGLNDLQGKLLIVDDDMKRSLTLDDGLLKKFSEDRVVTADVKFASASTFVSRAFFMINSNHWPRVRDITEAMRNRAFVMPFTFDFLEAGIADDQKRLRMYAEKSGIFNRFLSGVSRLRARGHFKYPQPCSDARAAWLARANPVSHFVSDCLERTNTGAVKRSDVMEAYSMWFAEEYGGAFRIDRGDVRERLGAMLGSPSKYQGHESYKHWKVKEQKLDDF